MMKYLIVFLVVIGLVSCQSGQKKGDGKAPAQNVVLSETTVNIGGMHCDNCVKSIEKGINELDGIAEVKVSLNDSTAFVKFDSAMVKVADINSAVVKRGFTVKEKLN